MIQSDYDELLQLNYYPKRKNVMDNKDIQLFENKQIRTAWDNEKEEWYFSVVDVIAVLTDSPNPQTYWRVMKKRLKDEVNETVTNCNGLKMTASYCRKS